MRQADMDSRAGSVCWDLGMSVKTEHQNQQNHHRDYMENP